MTHIRNILLIEDDRFIGEMYKHSLEKEDYQVDWIINGLQGLDAARSGEYDLVIIDIILPELQGTEIVRQVHEYYLGKTGPKVIVLTNYDQKEEDRLELEQISDAYYIKAEITPRKLMEIIAELETPDEQ